MRIRKANGFDESRNLNMSIAQKDFIPLKESGAVDYSKIKVRKKTYYF